MYIIYIYHNCLYTHVLFMCVVCLPFASGAVLSARDIQTAYLADTRYAANFRQISALRHAESYDQGQLDAGPALSSNTVGCDTLLVRLHCEFLQKKKKQARQQCFAWPSCDPVPESPTVIRLLEARDL